tara:strand:+ start:10227 stop:10394 length:168 start_codon:yes stop_codon:yes gene_type:complete
MFKVYLPIIVHPLIPPVNFVYIAALLRTSKIVRVGTIKFITADNAGFSFFVHLVN